jgi:hypothetical protein
MTIFSPDHDLLCMSRYHHLVLAHAAYSIHVAMYQKALKLQAKRVTHPDSGLNISDSFSILEREKISANYLSDLWPGERDHDKVVKPSSKLTEQRLFLICESCFWCTSYFRSGYLIHDCPVCYNGKLDSIPIGDGEKYRFDNSLPTGVEVQFSSDILMWSKNES